MAIPALFPARAKSISLNWLKYLKNIYQEKNNLYETTIEGKESAEAPDEQQKKDYI